MAGVGDSVSRMSARTYQWWVAPMLDAVAS
jgi:hypothetical protein